jgi:FkbM family methyltransferase
MAFSQNLEEQAILNYFKDKPKGTFLSLGENDGQTLSNVRALALDGWCGVMVEPSPRAFARLKALYDGQKKGCFYLYDCAIGNNNGKATLYDSGELLKKGDVALVSTLVEDQKNRFQSVLSYEPVEVKVYRWLTFYNRLKIKTFTFITIDCEGLDCDILEQMDLDALETELVCIEWNGNQPVKDRIDKKLAGFKVIYTSGENLIYAR